MTTRTGKMMTARYPGRCSCGASVAAGDQILYAGIVDGCAVCEFGEVARREVAAKKAAGIAKMLERPYRVRRIFATNAPGCYGWLDTTETFSTEAEARDYLAASAGLDRCFEADLDLMFAKDDEFGWDTRQIGRWRRPKAKKAA